MRGRKQYLKLVFGEVCSGKTTYAEENYPKSHIIDVGEVVRRLTEKETRIHDVSLDEKIVEYILHEILYSRRDSDTMVIVGIRQLTILKAIEKFVESTPTIEIETIYLDVPQHILKRRYLARKATKDSNISFEETIDRDNRLGLREVKEYLRTIKTAVVENYNSLESV